MTWARDALHRLEQVVAARRQAATPACEELARAVLTPALLAALHATDARDRAHQCRVALALSRAGCDDPTLLAAALLHDTGKSVTGRAPSLADRIAFVMLSKLRPSLVQRMAASGFPAGVASAARHAEVGADRLRRLGADPYLVWLVRHHHRDDIVDDPLLARLRAADRSVP